MSASPFPRFEALPYVEESSRYFDALKDLDWPVFLDSGGRLNGRSDIIAAAPCRKLVTRGDTTLILGEGNVSESRQDPFSLVREAVGEPAGHFTPLAFEGGAIGYFGYDLGRRLEKLPELARDIDGLPEMMIGIYDWVVVVDHEQRQAWLVAQGRSSQTAALWHELLRRLNQLPVHPAAEPLRAPGGFEAGIDREEYRRQFARIQTWIRDGDCYQVNYTQRFDAYVEGDGWQAYREMRALNPVPFGAFLRFDELEILSFSPERFLKLEGRRVTTEPIKGTRPRSEDPGKDLRLQRELSQSIKDRAENLMIVDLLRNDLGRSCVPGSIHVDRLFEIQSFPTVHHMVSTISGELAPGLGGADLLRHAFPGGSITGAPKRRAMEIIAELEPHARQAYCGSVFYLSADGRMDSNIAIRTLVLSGGQASFWAGGGIVAVVQDHAERVFVEYIHAARRLEVGGVEGAQAMADVVQRFPHAERKRGREHGVLHVVRGLALHRGRDQVGPQQLEMGAVVVQRDHVAVDALLQHHGASAGTDVLLDQGMGRVHGHVADVLGLRVIRHAQAMLVIRVQHRGITGHLDRYALDLGQLFQRVDPTQPQVVCSHVQAGRHVAALVAETRAQQTAACRFHDGHVDGGVS